MGRSHRYLIAMTGLLLAAASLAIWLYLVFARGFFWLGRERDGAAITLPSILPSVTIVVPARNEAENIAQSVTSLLRQQYPALSLIVVDDDSDDGTADVARRTAALARRRAETRPSSKAARFRRTGPASCGP